MTDKTLAVVVSDERPWGNIVTAIFKGQNAESDAARWAGESSRIYRIRSERRLARIRIMQPMPER